MSILDTNLISEIDKAIPVQFDIYNLPTGDHHLIKRFLEYVEEYKQQYNIGNWCLQALKELLEHAAFRTCVEMQVHLTDYPHAEMHIRQDSFNIHDDIFRHQEPKELEVEIRSLFPFPFCVRPIPPYRTDFKGKKRPELDGPGLYQY